jgi:hypothetical protein
MQKLSRSITVALVATLLIMGFIYPVSVAGSVTTAEDAIFHADLARKTYGVDGTGIKVAVISDNLGDYSPSLNSGDLPTVTVINDDSVGHHEGEPMLEIVHDIASGTDLYFYANDGFVMKQERKNSSSNC